MREKEAALWTGSGDDQPPELDAVAPVQGGRERGLIDLHQIDVFGGDERGERSRGCAHRGGVGRQPVEWQPGIDDAQVARRDPASIIASALGAIPIPERR